MKIYANLHSHSTHSDGVYTPAELVKIAKDEGYGALAITDHDTLLGIKNITYTSKKITIIKGIELSAKVSKGRMHILGYNIDANSNELNEKMNELRNNSLYSVLSLIIQIRNDYNIAFDYFDIKDLVNSTRNLGRPEIAKLCVKYGYATDVQDAFDKYLIDSYEKIKRNNKGLSYKECISLILKSGGIPILAHPKTLKLDKNELTSLIKEMVDYGLKGIEVYHSSHTIEDIHEYLDIANKFNLLISGGSDYHGPIVKPKIHLGKVANNKLFLTNFLLSNLSQFYND